MDYRPATPADLDAQHRIFRAAIGDLFDRHRFPPPDPPAEAFRNQQQHLLDHDPERCWMAEEDGVPVAFAAAMARGSTWFLSSLFVVPGAQGTGVGRELFDRVWGGAGYERRLTMTDSIQPASNGLYASRGLIPATPVLFLAGGARPAAAPALERARVDAAHLARLDLAAYGFDRAPDHVYWGRHAEPSLWLSDGEPVAYSYRWPNGRIGPLAGLDADRAAAALHTELARRPEASLLVPGSSRSLVAAAIGAGLRIHGPPGLLLTSDGVASPEALAISGFALL